MDNWFALVIALLAVVLVGWAVWRIVLDPPTIPWLWPAVATRVFASDPAVFEGFRHRGMTYDPDGGHPDDAVGLLSWWRQEPLRWRAEVRGCSRYACPAAPSAVADVPACDPRADTLTKSTVDTFIPHPTRREVRDKAAYRDLARYCESVAGQGHNSCRELMDPLAPIISSGYTANNVLGALETHPVIPGELHPVPPPPFRMVTQTTADALRPFSIKMGRPFNFWKNLLQKIDCRQNA